MADNTVYLGNQKLKKVNTPVNFTKEQVKEFIKCSNDPVYFIKKYVKIVHLDKGVVNFKLYDFQETMVNTFVNSRFSICKIPRQSGKDLQVDTPIPTINGFKRMGDLKVGDKIFDENGKVCNVTFVSDDIKGPGYKFIFDDKSEIICGKDHLWTYNDRFLEHKQYTKTAEEMYNGNWKKGPYKRTGGGNDKFEYAYYIPNTKPVQYEYQNITINPYLLGVWLGDGNSRCGQICGTKENIEHYKKLLPEEEFREEKIVRESFVDRVTIKNLHTNLRLYNLLQKNKEEKTKRIPIQYLFNSIDVRVKVLQGLMDTDGWIEKNGQACIQLTRKNIPLIEDVYTLLCSLGFKVTVQNNEKTNSRRLCFYSVGKDFDVVTLPKKLERIKSISELPRYTNSRTIQQIIPMDYVHGKCIQVDSPNRLFLAEKFYVVTHNTITVVAVMLWYVLFHQNYSIAILAHKLSAARSVLNRLQYSYEQLPKWLQQGIVGWNKGDIELENGSKILASATSSSAIRGGSFSMVYLDEYAFVPPNIQAEFFASVYPTISSGNTTKMIITSTPYGLNMFYKIWKDAEQGKNSFVPVAVHWSSIPGRDEKWKEETIKNTSEQQFRQEYETEFLGSQNTLISANKLLQMASVNPIKETEDYAIYQDPQRLENKKNLYIIVVDTARGVGGDNCAFVVFDVTTVPYKVVARYKNNTISPLIFPNIIYEFAKLYNDAYLCVEVNDNGQQVADILYRELEYENMVFTQFKGRAGQTMSTGFGTRPAVGIRTTKALKRIGCTNLKTLVESDKLIIEDNEIISELFQFIEVGESFEAEEGMHDDLVMCCVIFSWLTQQTYFKDWTDTNVRERMIKENSMLIDDELLPVISFDEDYIHDSRENKVITLSDREFIRFLLQD